MTFFTEAKADGHIDKKIEMSQQEFEMMLRGMLEDSSAWSLHKNKHKDARIAPIFKEEELSEFEQKVNKTGKHKEQGKIDEPQIIQYDTHTKMFVAGCNCGEKFKIDIKNDRVEQEDPSLKMKEINPYDKNRSQESYGREQNEDNNYNNKPAKQPAISYNSNHSQGMTYKN